MVLSTYGKSTGFCIDPIEKKPLNHFYPGTPVLSFGTAGCNLGCKFCQNWDISKSREVQRLSQRAEPETIARAAVETGCSSVAFTYNDPVIWAEYAIDTARACRERGIKAVAVTAGYISPEARRDFFDSMDAANVDLKAFNEEFYRKVTYSHLQPVLDTIAYLKRETNVWVELTNLIIPTENDSIEEMRQMCGWVLETVGDEVPIHFTAFHPDFRMRDVPPTDPETLAQAYEIAKSIGLKYPYVGNVHNVALQSTYCHSCGELLIERDWYRLGTYKLDESGRCARCSSQIPGHFAWQAGNWGSRREPIQIDRYAKPFQTAQGESQAAQNTSQVFPLKDVKVTRTNAGIQAGASGRVAPLSTKLLDIDRLTGEQRGLVLALAANGVAHSVSRQLVKLPEDVLGDFPKSVIMGVFVTLKRGGVLRGCCGVLGKPMQLGEALTNAAFRTAREDQRMTPISASELPYLNIDVTLLGPFKKIEAEGSERAQAVYIGKHGLMIQRGDKTGLLLPSVATERGWNAERFLQAVCSKAGLPIGAWESSDTTIMTFQGETLSSPLSELLPVNFQTLTTPPLLPEQVSAYARIAGENIVALLTGGTPSYVIPHLPDVNVNAVVLSMQWGVDVHAEDQQRGNALQVSFRPGVALQSTLYQMCQQAAQLFQQQRFNGQLQLGLTLGFDPAMHGYGENADLEGVDPSQRAIIISDARHCGLYYDPQQSPLELLATLRKALPVSSREGVVHSMTVVSTMPRVMSISVPSPVVAHGARPPAVAGKFYPAEDAARRAMVDKLVDTTAITQVAPLAIMVPHAGLKYSGAVAANVWRRVRDLNESTLLVISPKHTLAGVNWSVCPFDSWNLSSKVSFAADRELAQQIAEHVKELQLDAAAHQGEHGIEVQLPILEKLAPQAQVVGVALHGGSWQDIQQAAAELADLLQRLEKRPLLVISSDMNHYAPEMENRRRDRMALDALATGDPQHLLRVCRENDISMCGVVPAALVMETLHRLGVEFRVEEVDYTTSAEASGDKSQVVGYAGALFLPAAPVLS
jgi:AmmeMemoRadiSam system radical SAM enzyme/AmmeMemoRadiSam system protein B/uncharacterized protein (TIGR00296 family)